MRDSDVRRAAKTWLSAEYAHDDDTRIVEEMGVWSGSVRIDIAVINGSLSGYELKSDRDTLERLPRQSALYGRVFDYLFLIVGKRHVDKAQKILPAWWGIKIAVEGKSGIELLHHHAPSPNPSPDPYLIAELLSKEEAIGVLQKFGLDRGWRSKKIRLIHERLAKELNLHELKEQVRTALKTRPRGVMVRPFEHARCADSLQSLPSAPSLLDLFLPQQSYR
jgi:hypothetical protein